MRWISQPDAKNPHVAHQALVLKPDEPLGPAFVEYWKRILTDGLLNAATWGWTSLSIDIAERRMEEDEQGHMRAAFRTGLRKECPDVGHYLLRGDAFTCLERKGEDSRTFCGRENRWFLEQYALLKQAAHSPEVWALFQTVNVMRPLPVDAALAFGWFALQIGKDSFGPLSAEDQAMLEGREPAPADRLKDLMGGSDVMGLVRALNAALIAYTPSNFETICCQITEGVEQGRRALSYDIRCPNYPDQGTRTVNDRVHNAATELVQRMAPAPGTFPGAAIRLELQQDGTWQCSYEFMENAASAA